MCEVLDKLIAGGKARRKFDLLYKLVKNGFLSIDQAAKSIDKSVQELLDGFKEYNLFL